MWQDKLKEIIYILENSNVNEIEINFWGRKYRVSKQPSIVVNEGVGAVLPMNSERNIQNKAESDGTNKITKLIEKDSNIGEEILSPMPGTFYSAPTPDDDPFVVEGSEVKKGQTLCIIEAMKIMNEIESEFDGVVLEMKVKNSEPIEYNQPLFIIQPS